MGTDAVKRTTDRWNADYDWAERVLIRNLEDKEFWQELVRWIKEPMSRRSIEVNLQLIDGYHRFQDLVFTLDLFRGRIVELLADAQQRFLIEEKVSSEQGQP